MERQILPIDSLRPAPDNPRKDLKPGDLEYEKIKRSIQEFGYVDPIIWNRTTGNVVGGHQRLKVLRELGYTEIDCVVIEETPDREKALNIALNKVGGTWDNDTLAALLDELKASELDIKLTGFEPIEMAEVFRRAKTNNVHEDDFDPASELAKIDRTASRLGDLWVLGKHRLVCGDSTDLETMCTLMDGGKARIIWTDPPWNVDYSSEGSSPIRKKRARIENDNLTDEEFRKLLTNAFRNARSVAEPGCMVYVAMSSSEWGPFMDIMDELEYHWSSTIIWKKDKLVPSRKDYHTQHEPIWYGWIEGSRLCPLKDRKQSDVWDIARPKKSDDHPTMKPIELVARAIQNSSLEGDTVLDMFGGSGTTLIAADQTNRVARMIELSPLYCDVIVKRYAKARGTAAIRLVRDGQTLGLEESGLILERGE